MFSSVHLFRACPNIFWVYIFQCSDNSYYTGHTDNLEARLYQHYHKISPACYTATRRPVKLAYSAQFPSRVEALQAEKQIQGWSRKKKEALISGDLEKPFYMPRRNKKVIMFSVQDPTLRDACYARSSGRTD